MSCKPRRSFLLVLKKSVSPSPLAFVGQKNNQEFVQIPTARLKDRIEQLASQYGLRFIETEECYSSKTSFLDNDKLFWMPGLAILD